MDSQTDLARTESLRYEIVEGQQQAGNQGDADNGNANQESRMTPSNDDSGVMTNEAVKKPRAFSVPRRRNSVRLRFTLPCAVINNALPKQKSVSDDVTKNIGPTQRRWKVTVTVLSSLVKKLSPANALRKACDCYVKILGNCATQMNTGTALSLVYGPGRPSLDQMPESWSFGSSRYFEERSQVILVKEPSLPRRCDSFDAVSQTSPLQSCKMSARVCSDLSFRAGMQSKPMYTIHETA